MTIGRTVSTSTAVRDRRWVSGGREGMGGKGVELEPFSLMLRAFNSFSVFKWSC